MRYPLAAALLCIPPCAQSYVVSPAHAATAEGNENNHLPWYGSRWRYQQIHGDLLGTPRTFAGLSFRRNGDRSNQPAWAARTVDVEVVMALSTFASASTTFAVNYLAPARTVIPRKLVNLPSIVNHVSIPEPWTIHLPFDVPFPYAATTDVLWEIRVHANTNTFDYLQDAYRGFAHLDATNVVLGTGCTPTGGATPMALTPAVRVLRLTNELSAAWVVTDGPASAPVAVVLGASDPDLAVPGLCANLRTDLRFTITGATDGIGRWAPPPLTAPMVPAYVGARLHAQGIAADAGRSGLPFALSNGVQSTLPGFGTTSEPLRRIYEANPTAASGSTDLMPFGLVTRFTY
jgi:hypothetical protein